MALSVQVLDNATPWLKRIQAAAVNPAVRHAIGGGAARSIQDHLAAKDAAEPNSLGGRRTHYYARAARTVFYTVDSNGVTISIPHAGVALHYYGGTVVPVNAKYLTIPARAEAHGKRAGEFSDLEVLWGKNGPYALAQRWQSVQTYRRERLKGTHTGGETKYRRWTESEEIGGGVFFWLVKQAQIPADPTIIPSEKTILLNGLLSAAIYITRFMPNPSTSVPSVPL